jgi:peptidoglycan hydrolase-like protein with peptidoglycan-binding domain
VSNVSALADYIPAAWRAYQHLGEIQNLQQRAMPHIDALLALAPEAQRLKDAIMPSAPSVPKKGKGINVRQLQEMLNHYGAALNVDGRYGDATHAAVEHYQRIRGLTVDGWAATETLDDLFGRIHHEATGG